MDILSFALFGLLIVISPGADTILLFRNSARYGRRIGIITALGIGAGVSVHVTYSVIGISHLISQSVWLFSVIKYIGAGYLIYLGITSLFSSKRSLTTEKFVEDNNIHSNISVFRHFLQGFLCNTLNPKTMLFFLSIFTQIAAATTNNSLLMISYGGYLAILHALWFCLLACLVTSSAATLYLEKFGHRINQTCGVGLILFGTLLSATA